MAKTKTPKGFFELLEIDAHRIDELSGMFDELILDNAREQLNPTVKHTAIEVYMAALRKQQQAPDGDEGEGNNKVG